MEFKIGYYGVGMLGLILSLPLLFSRCLNPLNLQVYELSYSLPICSLNISMAATDNIHVTGTLVNIVLTVVHSRDYTKHNSSNTSKQV